MENPFDLLNGIKGSDVKTSGEEGSLTPKIIGNPGNYELYITGLAEVRKSESGKVSLKFDMETPKPQDASFKPMESAKLGGSICRVQIGIYFDPSDASSNATTQFYNDLAVIAKKANKYDQFEKLDKTNFGAFIKGFLQLMNGVKLAYQLGGDVYYQRDKNDESKIWKKYSLKFGRYGFVKEKLEELKDFEENKSNLVKEFEANAGNGAQQELHKEYTSQNGGAPVETKEESPEIHDLPF